MTLLSLFVVANACDEHAIIKQLLLVTPWCDEIYCLRLHHFTFIKNIFFLFAVLPPTTSTSKATKLEDICRKSDDGGESSSMSSLASNSTNSSTSSSTQQQQLQQQTSRRLISVDFSLFKVSFYCFLNSATSYEIILLKINLKNV